MFAVLKYSFSPSRMPTYYTLFVLATFSTDQKIYEYDLLYRICDHRYWRHFEIVVDCHPETSLWLPWYWREKREPNFLCRGHVSAE